MFHHHFKVPWVSISVSEHGLRVLIGFVWCVVAVFIAFVAILWF